MEIEYSEKVVFIMDISKPRRLIIKTIGTGSSWISQILNSLEFLLQKNPKQNKTFLDLLDTI